MNQTDQDEPETLRTAQLVHEIVSRNNEGLILLQHSKQDAVQAIRSLRQALLLLTQNQDNLQSSAPPMDITSSSRIGSINPSREKSCRAFLQETLLSNSGPISGLEDECFYIHNQALVLDPNILMADPANMLSLASVSILFNLALACHCMGIKYNDESKLQNALVLYDLCNRFAQEDHQVNLQETEAESNQEHQQQGQPLAAAYPEFVRVLTWACLNNKGQILYRPLHQEADAADILREELSPIFQGAVELGGVSTFLKSNHVDEIVLNILLVSSAGDALIASPAA